MWTIEFLNRRVFDELDVLPEDVQASFKRIAEVIKSNGLAGIPRNYVRHLEGKLWELRLHGGDGIARAIYVTAVGQRLVILRVFVKKSQKTPRQEIALAIERSKDIE